MTITKIDRETLRRINNDVIAALGDVQKKYGIQISAGRGHFTGGASGDLKLEYRVLTAAGVASIDEDTKWAIRNFGLTDGEVYWPGHPGMWRITGYSSRASRYPIVVTERGGKSFKIPLFTAQTHFKAQATQPKAPEIPVIETKQPQMTPQREYNPTF